MRECVWVCAQVDVEVYHYVLVCMCESLCVCVCVRERESAKLIEWVFNEMFLCSNGCESLNVCGQCTNVWVCVKTRQNVCELKCVWAWGDAFEKSQKWCLLLSKDEESESEMLRVVDKRCDAFDAADILKRTFQGKFFLLKKILFRFKIPKNSSKKIFQFLHHKMKV